MPVDVLELLEELREWGGARKTLGLPDHVIQRFAAVDRTLPRAVQEAVEAHRVLREEHGDLLAGDEADLPGILQARLINFYPPETVNPYVALAAAGPWVVTTHGAVIHDNGGYGMLGLGHGPADVMEAMSLSWVMANVMTPSLSHKRLTDRLEREIGHTRGGCPYSRFVCLNSGSESVTLANRIADVSARVRTDQGGSHQGQQVIRIALAGAFHGRTQRPSELSDSCRAGYRRHLATFRDREDVWFVPPNDPAALRAAFDRATDERAHVSAMFMEPVMGEGDPGKAIEPAFYALARELTREHGALLVVDSIQAGLRAHGVLSVVDFPGFRDLDPPDMETYSKALNAGQYPLSVVAFSPEAAGLYRRGIYGNTMTSNPRALEVACAVLDGITPDLRQNIVDRGAELVRRFRELAEEMSGRITRVQGTGLLASVELAEDLPVVAFGGIEEWCRVHGIGVVHGGANSLRYTPHFRLTSAEIDLLVDNLRQALVAAARAGS